MKEKIMPHNLEAEQAVLGSMFLSKYALQKCLESLSSELFYLEAHSKIFEVISSLQDSGKPVDVTTVTAELEDRTWLKQIGNVEYLTEIVNAVPTALNVDEYIKIVEEKAILRRLIKEATEIVTIGYDTTRNLDDTLNDAEKKILNVVKTKKGREFRSIQDVLLKTQSDLEKLSQSKGEITGIPTGYSRIDKITTGLHPNELIILAARPGVGKTAFALNLATNIAINTDETVALLNMEMSAEQLVTRMLSATGQIDGTKLKSGRLENSDWKRVNEAISRLADTKIYIDDTSGQTINEIKAKCRRLSTSSDGLGIIIIDYLQLIGSSNRYAGQRTQEVSEISRSLKTMAMELGVPVIALAQLSRGVEQRIDKKPLLSDLRESGSIEQDADIVAFLHREDYYEEAAKIDDNTSRIEFIIKKHRNGPTDTIPLMFKKNTNTFVSILEDYVPGEEK